MAIHKIIYAKCPYCGAEQPWNSHAASDEFSDGISQSICPHCGEKIIIVATNTMKFFAKKFLKNT